MCVDVLNGLSDDDRLAAFIFALDESDEWDEPKNWIKSNPNLGITVDSEYIAGEVESAKNMPSAEVGVRTKTINQWCDTSEVWIPEHYLTASSEEIKIAEHADTPCFIGVDLSATRDLTALAMMWELDGIFFFKVKYYLPQESLDENRFKELYGEWWRKKLITLTPGNVTDYDFILNDIKAIDGVTSIEKIAYDAWNATQFVINATDAGLPMEPFSQSLGNFNKPTKEMERLILSGKARIDNNEINRHCFRNVVLALDRNGNTKPSKQFVEKKIDGVIAMLEALGAWLNSPRWNAEL